MTSIFRNIFVTAPIFFAIFLAASWLLFYSAPIKQDEVLVTHIILGSVGVLFTWLVLGVYLKVMLGGGRADSWTVVYFIISSVCFLICQLFMFGIIYKATGLKTDRVLDHTAYFYFSTMTLATVGYGDIIPSDDARIFTIIEVLLGYIYLGLFLGLTTFMIGQVNEDNR